MKKISLLSTILLAAFAISFQSCKRGENDPFISFKSRTERLAGSWKLTAKQGTDVTNFIYPSSDSLLSATSVYSFNGSTGIEQVTYSSNSSASVIRNFQYTFKLDFDKKGDYKYDAVFYRPINGTDFLTQVYNGTGNWSWLDKGKDKVAINLFNEGTIAGLDTLDAQTSMPYQITNEYYIDRLTATEMVWKIHAQMSAQVDTLTVIRTQDYTFTFGR